MHREYIKESSVLYIQRYLRRINAWLIRMIPKNDGEDHIVFYVIKSSATHV
jgi:hypothetical protein